MNLQHLVKQLVISYQPVAVNQRSLFINSIPDDFIIGNGTRELAQITSSLLYVVARCSPESILTIDAGVHDDLTFLVISCNNTKNRYGALHEFQHLKLLAKKMEGILDINYGSTKTTISFGFKNNTIAKNGVIKEMKRA